MLVRVHVKKATVLSMKSSYSHFCLLQLTPEEPSRAAAGEDLPATSMSSECDVGSSKAVVNGLAPGSHGPDKDMDPTKICTGKGTVTLRASSSYRETPSSSPVSPQESPKHESKSGRLPWSLGGEMCRGVGGCPCGSAGWGEVM